MKDLDWPDIANRVGWTFVQAFIATVAAAGADYVNATVLKSAGIAGLAAAISLLKNIFVQARSGGSGGDGSADVVPATVEAEADTSSGL